jgi:hypothetical protein
MEISNKEKQIILTALNGLRLEAQENLLKSESLKEMELNSARFQEIKDLRDKFKKALNFEY